MARSDQVILHLVTFLAGVILSRVRCRTGLCFFCVFICEFHYFFIMTGENRKRAWCFTTFDMTLFNRDWNGNDKVKYIIMGREICPDTGRRHLQGYVEFVNRKSLDMAKKILKDNTIHLEKRRGTQEEAIEYCKKDGDWKEWGVRDEQGRRRDLEDCRNMLEEGKSMLDIGREHFGDFVRYYKGFTLYKDLLDRERAKNTEARAPEVIVYVGGAGSGKSYRCYNDPDYQSDGYQFMCQQSGKVFFDGYEKQTTIWFDEFNGAILPFQLWLRLCDAYGLRVETKGGSVHISGIKKILISTTTPPARWWNCSKFLEDPNQLWRRLSKVYYLRQPRDGVYPEPILIKEPQHLTSTLMNEYERSVLSVC